MDWVWGRTFIHIEFIRCLHNMYCTVSYNVIQCFCYLLVGFCLSRAWTAHLQSVHTFHSLIQLNRSSHLPVLSFRMCFSFRNSWPPPDLFWLQTILFGYKIGSLLLFTECFHAVCYLVVFVYSVVHLLLFRVCVCFFFSASSAFHFRLCIWYK